MPDQHTMTYVTTGIYWALILCWSAILIFYGKEYRWLRRISPLIAGLVIVIFIDGARTLAESLYFGVWYTARTGLISYRIYTLLQEPQYVVIPKAMNLIAALVIMGFLVRRWFRDAEIELRRHAATEASLRELEEAHAQLQRLENLRDDLVQMIAHDMRTPLTSVIGSLRTALEEQEDGPVRSEMVRNALTAAERLQGMTGDLLVVNKLERGQLELELERVDVEAVARESIAFVRLAAQEKGVELAPPSLEGDSMAAVDPELLGRILTNLLQNAVRHTPQGGTASVHIDRPDGNLRIQVADTGEGVPPELRERIFDKFFHAAHQRNGGAASIGLGLAFCKLATEAHGGTIRVESEVGLGSTFVVEIPQV